MKVRIVSSGHGRETHVFGLSDDGTLRPIHGVQAVMWEVPHPTERALAKLTVYADVNVVGDVEEWRPVPPEDGMALAPEPGVPLWALGIALIIIALVGHFFL
jgi:hypothetical protein